MSTSTKDLVKKIGTLQQRPNPVTSAMATAQLPTTKTVTQTYRQPQGFFDRLLHGEKAPITTTAVVPLTGAEIAEQAAAIHQIELRAAAATRAAEVAAMAHIGDLKEQEVRIVQLETQATDARKDLLNAHYAFEAAERQWPEKEEIELTKILTEKSAAQTAFLRTETGRVTAEVELYTAMQQLHALTAPPAAPPIPPRRQMMPVKPKTDDQLRTLARSCTNDAIIGNVEPTTWDRRWLPRAGATFIERYMNTRDRALAEKDTYTLVLNSLRMENNGELVIDMDEARSDYAHFRDLEEQARELGFLDEMRETMRSYNRSGGKDAFARTKSEPIDVEPIQTN